MRRSKDTLKVVFKVESERAQVLRDSSSSQVERFYWDGYLIGLSRAITPDDLKSDAKPMAINAASLSVPSLKSWNRGYRDGMYAIVGKRSGRPVVGDLYLNRISVRRPLKKRLERNAYAESLSLPDFRRCCYIFGCAHYEHKRRIKEKLFTS